MNHATSLAAAIVLLGAAGGTARAAPSDGSYTMVDVGLSLGAYSRQGRALGAEASLWRVSPARVMYGVDAGLTGRTWSAEAELAGPVLERRSQQLVVLAGLGVGLVHAHEATGIGLRATDELGFQATAWALVIPEMPLPLLPYVRFEGYHDATVVGAGLMLKIPILVLGR
jgi:hypothetical protein